MGSTYVVLRLIWSHARRAQHPIHNLAVRALGAGDRADRRVDLHQQIAIFLHLVLCAQSVFRPILVQTLQRRRGSVSGRVGRRAGQQGRREVGGEGRKWGEYERLLRHATRTAPAAPSPSHDYLLYYHCMYAWITLLLHLLPPLHHRLEIGRDVRDLLGVALALLLRKLLRRRNGRNGCNGSETRGVPQMKRPIGKA